MDLTFTIENETIFLNGLPVYCYSGTIEKQYYSSKSIEIIKTDCGYRIDVTSVPDDKVALVFPCKDADLMVGNRYEVIDTSIVQHFTNGPSDSLSKSCSVPIVHVIHDTVWSFSLYGECDIVIFKEHYEQYFSIQTTAKSEITSFFIDIASNYLVNLQRHPFERTPYVYYGLIDEPIMMNVLHNGLPMIKSKPDVTSVMEQVKSINSIFRGNGIFPVFTGGVAKHLNGIECNVTDIDLMVKTTEDMKFVSQILYMIGYQVSHESLYYIRMTKNESVTIDISYDNFNVLLNNWLIDYSELITYLNVNGLLWMALLNLQEFDRTRYRDMCSTNDKALFELTLLAHDKRPHYSYNDKIIKEMESLESKNIRCQFFSDKLSTLDLQYRDTRINEPFRINAFGNTDNRIYSIVNTGSKNNCRIVADFVPSKAVWRGLDGEDIDAEISGMESFSIIEIKKPILHGVLECI